MRFFLAATFLLSITTAHAGWFRGNTHAHTLESDGDSSPADVVRWYAEHGYDFLVITDHDKVTTVAPGSLLLIPGEEVTDHLPKRPLHLCALGITAAIKPRGGATVAEVLQHDVDAIHAAGGIAAINHPNFGWAFGSAELLKLEHADLLEIASGHPFVNIDGPPSIESMWDDMLTAGRRVWGVGVDDSHHFKRPWDTDIAPPGKAWIVVRAEKLEASAILAAIRVGDFYASTGVELVDYNVTASTMTVSVKVKNLAHYHTQFIGPKGRVLRDTTDNPATFDLRKTKSYVRAKVIDSNGKAAWLQPWFSGR